MISDAMRSILTSWFIGVVYANSYFNIEYDGSCDTPCSEISVPIDTCFISELPVFKGKNVIFFESGDLYRYGNLIVDNQPVCNGTNASIELDVSGTCNYTSEFNHYTITQSPDPVFKLKPRSTGCSSYNNAVVYVFIGVFIVVFALVGIFLWRKSDCRKPSYNVLHESVNIDDDDVNY